MVSQGPIDQSQKQQQRNLFFILWNATLSGRGGTTASASYTIFICRKVLIGKSQLHVTETGFNCM